jgi:hypothetical protein
MHRGQQPLLAFVFHPAVVVAADDEPQALAVPAAVMIDRIGLAVDDVHARLGPGLLLDEAEGRQQAVELAVPKAARARAAGEEEPLGGPQAQVDGGNGLAVVVGQQQGGVQLIA